MRVQRSNSIYFKKSFNMGKNECINREKGMPDIRLQKRVPGKMPHVHFRACFSPKFKNQIRILSYHNLSC